MKETGASPYRAPKNVGGTVRHEDVLKKTNVLLMFILTFVTFYLYGPIWFLRRRKTFNALGGNMSIWPFVVALFSIAVAQILQLASTHSMLASSFQFIGYIVILVESFIVKDILENASQTDDGGDFLPHERLSGVLTFLFTIYYLQHKINVMDAVDAKTPPLGSRLMLWGAAFAGLVGIYVVGLMQNITTGVEQVRTILQSNAVIALAAFAGLVGIYVVGLMQNITTGVEQVRTILQSNAVIVEHIGRIETLEIDWTASGETADNVLVYNIGGNKGAGRVTAELQEAPEKALVPRLLVMNSGESYELVPPP